MKRDVGFNNRDRFVELGLMISAVRKAKGYTQYELAEKAHISPLILALLKPLM